MKLFLQILSSVIALALIITVGYILFDISAVKSFAGHAVTAITLNIVPIIIIAIACISIQNKVWLILPRTIIIYSGLVIILYLFNTTFDLASINESLATGSMKLYLFLAKFQPIVLLGSFFLISRPGNIISDIIFKISIGLFVLIIAISLYENTLMDVMDFTNSSQGFYTSNFTKKLFFASFITYIVSIPLYFITNYAFDSADVPEIDAALNVRELKEKAEETNKNKINSIYSPEVVVENTNVPSNPNEYKEKGLMNLNNSLNQNSNVGQVTNSDTPKDTLRFDPDLPVVQAPVENTQVNKEDSQ